MAGPANPSGFSCILRGGEAEPEWYLGVGVKVHIVVQEHSLVKSGYVREPITRKSGYVVDRLG